MLGLSAHQDSPGFTLDELYQAGPLFHLNSEAWSLAHVKFSLNTDNNTTKHRTQHTFSVHVRTSALFCVARVMVFEISMTHAYSAHHFYRAPHVQSSAWDVPSVHESCSHTAAVWRSEWDH